MDCIRCGAKFDVFEGSCPTCNWNPDDILDELAGHSIGDKIQDQYEIQESLGVGRFGTVLSVFDHKRHGALVMKVFHPAVLPDPKTIDAFLGGIEDLVELQHPMIPLSRDSGVDEKYRCFIVRDFVEGIQLRKIIEQRREQGRVFSIIEVVSLLGTIASVYLDVPGLVHGSLSPKRIWLSSNDLETADVKITGCGIVCNLPPQVVWHRIRKFPTSRGYAPPELLMGRHPDRYSDVYTAGVMVGEMLTGVSFDGQPEVFMESSPKLDDGVFAIIERAISSLPNRRYPDLPAMFDALAEICGDDAPAQEEAVQEVAVRDETAQEEIVEQELDLDGFDTDMDITPVPSSLDFGVSVGETDLFDDTAQVSMEDVIRAHVERVDLPTPEPSAPKLSRPEPPRPPKLKIPVPATAKPKIPKPRSSRPPLPRPSRPPLPRPSTPSKPPPPDETSQSGIEPIRPLGVARLPSFVPPPVAKNADDPVLKSENGFQTEGSRTNPYSKNGESIQRDRRDKTQEIDLNDAELMGGVLNSKEDSSVTNGPTIEKAANKLERRAQDAEKESTDELLRRAGRLDGVDPRLVRAAHALESERLRDRSINAAQLIRDKGDSLDGIDPRFLRAAAKLEEAKVHDRQKSSTSKKKRNVSNGEPQTHEESSDAVISFLAPPVTGNRSDVSGFPGNRKRGVRSDKPPAPRPKK